MAMKTTHRASEDKIAAKEAGAIKREKLVDDAIEDSFPASDPPSFMGASATGAPKKRKANPAIARTDKKKKGG